MAARVAADAEGAGAVARAYMHAVLDESHSVASTDVLRVLVAMITDCHARALVGADAEWTRPDPVPLEQAATLMIYRLAADGLWISKLSTASRSPPNCARRSGGSSTR